MVTETAPITEELEELYTSSTSEEEVPEESENKLEETEEGTEEVKGEAEETKAKVEEAPLLTTEIENYIKAEADKRTRSLNGKNEANRAYIYKLQAERAELRKALKEKHTAKLTSLLVDGYDEEGLPPEDKGTFQERLKEINQKVAEYNEKYDKVDEAAQLISSMAEKMPSNVVKGFGLDDPNPDVRATNGVKFFEETASVFKYNRHFSMAIEEFLPKGDEVRKQIEEAIKGLVDSDSDDSKKRYLKDQMKGLLTPKRRPNIPSDSSGGKDRTTYKGDDWVKEGLKEPPKPRSKI